MPLTLTGIYHLLCVICHFDIVILKVAIISNVQNVRLQRRRVQADR